MLAFVPRPTAPKYSRHQAQKNISGATSRRQLLHCCITVASFLLPATRWAGKVERFYCKTKSCATANIRAASPRMLARDGGDGEGPRLAAAGPATAELRRRTFELPLWIQVDTIFHRLRVSGSQPARWKSWGTRERGSVGIGPHASLRFPENHSLRS
jgi:hypothetical protein